MEFYYKEVEEEVTHGGLECGIILSKYPHLEAVSLGSVIHGAH